MNVVAAVCLDDTNDFSRVNFQVRSTDAVAWLVDRNLATVRRVERNVYIMKSADFSRDMFVKFNDDFVGHMGESRDIADACTQQDFTVVADFSRFDDSNVNLAEESVAEVLRQL